jgi:hypothetical protein
VAGPGRPFPTGLPCTRAIGTNFPSASGQKHLVCTFDFSKIEQAFDNLDRSRKIPYDSPHNTFHDPRVARRVSSSQMM